MRYSESHKQETHTRLVKIAARMLREKGPDGFAVAELMNEAGLTHGGFYAHFRNKEDVFAAVLEALGEKIREVLLEAKAAEPDPVRALSAAIARLFLFLAENPGAARILIVESSGLSPRLERVRRGILRQHEELVRLRLESAPECFETENSAIAARCMVGAVYEALYSWLEELPLNRLPAAEAAHLVSEYNLRALRRR